MKSTILVWEMDLLGVLGGCTGASAGTAGAFAQGSGRLWNLLTTSIIPPAIQFDADSDGSLVVVIG